MSPDLFVGRLGVWGGGFFHLRFPPFIPGLSPHFVSSFSKIPRRLNNDSAKKRKETFTQVEEGNQSGLVWPTYKFKIICLGNMHFIWTKCLKKGYIFAISFFLRFSSAWYRANLLVCSPTVFLSPNILGKIFFFSCHLSIGESSAPFTCQFILSFHTKCPFLLFYPSRPPARRIQFSLVFLHVPTLLWFSPLST